MLRSFNEVHYACKVDGDPGATAKAIVLRLKLTGPQAEVLLPVIEEYCKDLDRSRVKRIEADGPAGRKVSDPAGERAAYLSERFAVGDGRMVKWSEATVDDHTARIDFLRKMRGGIDATIGRHSAAIELLNKHGAKCLGEIADLPATLVPTAAEMDLSA